MKLIKIFTGILLLICLINCINIEENSKITKANKTAFDKKNKTILGLKVEEFKGKIRVEEISEYSPARIAGIEVGDKILEVEGNKISTIENFVKNIENTDNKDKIKMTIYRVDSCSKFPVEVDKNCIISY